MKPWAVPLFVVAAAFAPVALLVRYGVLTPLSLAIPPLRRVVMERYSGLIINPMFRRRAPEGEFRRHWAWQEVGAWAWSARQSVGVGKSGAGVVDLGVSRKLTKK